MLCVVSLLFNRNNTLLTNPETGDNAPAQALLLYLAVYLFMNLGAFAVAAMVYRATNSEDISAFDGLAQRHPILAHSMFACLISLIGLPPFAGFIAKLNVLRVLIDSGGWWWVLVAAIAINSILSAFYYFRVVRAMYVKPGVQPAFTGHPLGVALSALCGIVLFLMLILAGPISNLATHYSKLQGITAHPAPDTQRTFTASL
jgi:NADH-quinone oxidoreductase subunit N